VTNERILLAGAVLLLAVVAAVATQRLRLPLLVTFLGLGMLLGSEGLGGIDFDDAELARWIGTAGLVLILFEGGLTTRWVDLRPVLGPTLVLSTVGVAVTAAVAGAAAYFLFDLDVKNAFLLGAVIGPTDAAAVFATLRGTMLRRRLASLLTAESGANDPVAVALTLGLIAWIRTAHYGGDDLTVLLVRELGLGLAIGLALGLVVRHLPRLPSELATFGPVASLGIAAVAYGIPASLHASGFLSVYIVGLFLGNTATPLRQTVVHFQEGLAYLSQVVLFVVLGLLVFPSRLGPVAWSALALTAILVLVARPLAVAVSVTPFRYSWREQAFVSWAGLRGAVPIVLATFALSARVAGSDTIFNAVFFVVLVSAVLQTVTLNQLARRLGVAGEARPLYHPPVEVGAVRALGGDILEYDVEQSDAVVGARIEELGLPEPALVMLIVRDGQAIPPRGSTMLEPGDRVYVLARSEARGDVEAVVEEWERRRLARDRARGRTDRGAGRDEAT
jgi:cell volume regulation protein A